MAQQHNYQVSGNWAAADTTANHAEVCDVDGQPDLLAVRSTFTPDNILFLPRQQLINLATSINSGQMTRVGLHG